MIDEVEAWTVEKMRDRLVRYDDLRPCYSAFIDTRTPGSEAKENFTIIGPGVSENPDQYVHITEPHGYNIGGARQPAGCVNSQHSHKTAEVFVVHSGRWSFDLGENGEDAQVVLEKGDVISIPTDIFRGFTNLGPGSGFLWAILGEDNPGRVTWAPKVFELASKYGLILLESGRLIDTTKGDALAEGDRAMPPTSPETVASMQRVSPEEAERFVWRAGGSASNPSTHLIGRSAFWSWPHGFTLERRQMAAGAELEAESCSGSKVLFVQKGDVELSWDGGSVTVGKGDTFSVPRRLRHSLASKQGAEIFLVREGDDSLG